MEVIGIGEVPMEGGLEVTCHGMGTFPPLPTIPLTNR
jgi:hypothetical protein